MTSCRAAHAVRAFLIGCSLLGLSATGIAAPTVSPPAISFGTQTVGTRSASQVVAFQASSTINITRITVSFGFEQTNSCPSFLLGGGSCTIDVLFFPLSTGAYSGTLTITTNDPSSPHTVSLSGTGVVPPTLTPVILAFGSQLLNTASTTQTVTLQSAAALTISNIGVAGDFTQTNSCPSSLPAQGSCTISVSFRPTVVGMRVGTLTVSDNGAGSPRTVVLGGSGVAANPVPTVALLSPLAAAAGGPAFTLTVRGLNFLGDSVVQWNGVNRTTYYVNSTDLRVLVAAADIASVGTASVRVFNSAPGGGASNAASFPVVTNPIDDIRTALPIPRSPANLLLDTQGVGASPDDPIPLCGNGSRSNSAWFVFPSPIDGTLTVDTDGSDYLTIVSVWTGSPGAFAPVACAAGVRTSAQGDAAPAPASLTIPITKGSLYLFMVTGAEGRGGKLGFNLKTRSIGSLPDSALLSTLPHVVSGGGFVTKMTVVNFANAPNDVVINLLAQDGSLQGTHTLSMAAGEVARVATAEDSRIGPAQTQWAAVGSSGPVEVNLFFELTDQTPLNNVINTVGFNDADAVKEFTIPVEFEPGTGGAIGRTVGIALANPGLTPTTVVLRLIDDYGTLRATDYVPLMALAQTAVDLWNSPAFHPALTAGNFVGTLTGTSAWPVSVVALGDDCGPFFATPIMQTPAARIYLPHIVRGGGYVTKLTFVNPSAAAANVTMIQYLPSGSIDQQVSFTIPAHGARRIATAESGRFGASITTWAIVDSDQPISANLFFEVILDQVSRAIVNTIGFNDSPLMSEFSFPVEFEPGRGGSIGRTVGLAVANPWPSATSVTLRLLSPDGTVLATRTRDVPALGQLAIDLSTDPVFSAVLPATNFVGAVTVVAARPVAAIALEDDLGPFSALPVMPGRPL